MRGAETEVELAAEHSRCGCTGLHADGEPVDIAP